MKYKAQTRIHLIKTGRGVVGINKEVIDASNLKNKDKLVLTYDTDTQTITLKPF